MPVQGPRYCGVMHLKLELTTYVRARAEAFVPPLPDEGQHCILLLKGQLELAPVRTIAPATVAVLVLGHCSLALRLHTHYSQAQARLTRGFTL